MAKLLWTQKQDFGPKPRVGHALAYDETRGRVVLFGGDTIGHSSWADTWEWDGENWTQVADTGPSARTAHGMAFDAQRRQAVVFGGQNGAALLADTWAWDGENWTQLADAGPTRRLAHRMAYDVNRKRIVLFGGAGADGSLGDTWEWDGLAWTQVEDTGPSARATHVMAYDSGRGRTVLFGGNGADGVSLGDTWEWAGQAWVQAAEFGATACTYAAMAFDGKGVALFGGIDLTIAAPGRISGNTWEWDGKHWTERQDMGPGPRWGHAMAYDSRRQRMVLFGGTPVGDPFNLNPANPSLGDTWEHTDSGAATGAVVVTLLDFTISPNTIQSGQVAHATITLTGPAPAGGATVQITSVMKGPLDYAFNPMPPIQIPANSTSATFDMHSSLQALGINGPDIIRASLGAVSKDAGLTTL